ncbi:MAG: aconitase X catalytic domain-containing protein [Coriobacteriales bacterium]|nr:aconitase X catalytic domain-containing protein [Coriobacteriales bacterium]
MDTTESTSSTTERAQKASASSTTERASLTTESTSSSLVLTEEQQALLDGAKGEAMAKVVKVLVMYGETFGATRMVPVTSRMGHLVTSFGLSALKPVYELLDGLIREGALSQQQFTVDPRPLDANVKAGFIADLVFKFMYSRQDFYEKQLSELGLVNQDGFTCACYFDEVGNVPAPGDVLSWAESSAVVYANSVLGARCNRNSGIIELFGSVAGFVPYFGLLTDEGRTASWIIDVQTTQKPEAQVLGSAIGMKVMEAVPYIKGLDRWLGSELDQTAKDYLKDMGAATASNGAVGLYHVDGLTPEARALGTTLVADDAPTYVIDDAELARVKASYPVIWKDPQAQAKLAFVGCPHLSTAQLHDWATRLDAALTANKRSRVAVKTVFTTAPAVRKAFEATDDYQRLTARGVTVSSICPLMFMNNPLCGKMPVVTNSNKLRTYTTARYHTDAELLTLISGGEL